MAREWREAGRTTGSQGDERMIWNEWREALGVGGRRKEARDDPSSQLHVSVLSLFFSTLSAKFFPGG